MQMIALKTFPHEFGQAYRRVQEGEVFEALDDDVKHLIESGKAKPVADPAPKGKKG